MGTTAAAPTQASGRHQRKLRNYLLDKHFQLKYTGYLVAIALVLSVSLGIILKQTSDEVLDQSRQAVTQGEQVVARGREVVAESQKVSEVVKMNIVKDPFYADNPALKEAFERDAKDQDDRLAQQQKDLEAQAGVLKQQSELLAKRQVQIGTALVAILALLVLGIGIAGILVTHKVAGPIFKMQRHLRDVRDGKLTVPWGLRKGDELVEFFETFREMVKELRARQEAEIKLLDEAIGKLEEKASKDDLAPIYAVRKEMQDALEA